MNSRQKYCIFFVYGILGMASGIVVVFSLSMLLQHRAHLAMHVSATPPSCNGQCHAVTVNYRIQTNHEKTTWMTRTGQH